ncbi:DUF6505 family protein [Enterovirga aerilata]|uniref:Uncharacterized protein n=1 Tax=Enterovirga aerilata TaxID=2730920 RepID=A0A849IEC8_9HYPH|nr:DUF6505 family protein [Enterovirga sp. DB1703]NNM74809.1 hypothetical protein [Enterovirga sp. DB1703]
MTITKLPRTIRLDPSDTFVFERAAEPGEWAVAGSFMFLDLDPAALTGKARAAFRSGFVGVSSLGFSTLVVVSEAGPDEVEAATTALARRIREQLGAPDDATALAAAEEEIAAAASLCGPPPNTILALHRTFQDGELREQFRTLTAKEPGLPGADRLHAGLRVFQFVEADEEPEERIDLAGLMAEKRA